MLVDDEFEWIKVNWHVQWNLEEPRVTSPPSFIEHYAAAAMAHLLSGEGQERREEVARRIHEDLQLARREAPRVAQRAYFLLIERFLHRPINRDRANAFISRWKDATSGPAPAAGYSAAGVVPRIEPHGWARGWIDELLAQLIVSWPEGVNEHHKRGVVFRLLREPAPCALRAAAGLASWRSEIEQACARVSKSPDRYSQGSVALANEMLMDLAGRSVWLSGMAATRATHRPRGAL